jgi:hypothetical protein
VLLVQEQRSPESDIACDILHYVRGKIYAAGLPADK